MNINLEVHKYSEIQNETRVQMNLLSAPLNFIEIWASESIEGSIADCMSIF
jgi:hypothetical protein